MQFFGLVSLLIVIALVGWWLVSSGPASPSGELEHTGYQGAIESAEEAADLLER